MTVPRSTVTYEQAVARALALVGKRIYRLGASSGEYRDCVGFAWEDVYGMPRHVPGLNHLGGGIGDVEDDANCNSLIGDALTEQRYVEIVTTPFPGALVLYPTIRDPRAAEPFIGHVGVVVGVSRCGTFRNDAPDYSLLDTVQCCGPNGRDPGVLALPGTAFAEHAHLWPLPQHTTRMVRMLPP